MKFVIQVNCGPCHGPGASMAWQFAAAALRQGHQIERIFFFHDGVLHAAHHNSAGLNTAVPWSELAAQHGLDLVICSTAALRRGLGTSTLADSALGPGFRSGGLGQLVEAIQNADRFLVFG